MKYTIKQLKEAISNLPDDMVVYQQGDPEGNSFRPCSGIDPTAIVVKEDGEYVIYDTQWTASDACMTEEDWQEILKLPRVAVIFPGY